MFSFDEANLKGKEVMDGMLKSYAEVNRVFQAIVAEASEYSKQSCLDGVAHIEALSSVKSPEAALELTTTYMRSTYEGVIAEMSRIGDMYVDLARTVYRPFEAPIAKKPAGKSPAATSITPETSVVTAA